LVPLIQASLAAAWVFSFSREKVAGVAFKLKSLHASDLPICRSGLAFSCFASVALRWNFFKLE
jgi:hypothetical protein